MVTFEVDALAGGRISSLRVNGHEVLWTDRTGGALAWGAYPMVPYAGRVRHGRFSFAGRRYELPVNLGAHAIHGSGFVTSWDVEPDGTMVHELPWVFGGVARHRVRYGAADSITASLEVTNDHRAMPAQVGWHPWFRRPVTLQFAAGAMYRRDADGLPDGTMLRPPPPGPYDDCFTDVDQPLRLDGASGSTLALSSSCDHWVIYDEPRHALCAEPQSGPPDAFNQGPYIVEPGRPLVASFTIAVVAGPSPCAPP